MEYKERRIKDNYKILAPETRKTELPLLRWSRPGKSKFRVKRTSPALRIFDVEQIFYRLNSLKPM